jgi:hypothetical protein
MAKAEVKQPEVKVISRNRCDYLSETVDYIEELARQSKAKVEHIEKIVSQVDAIWKDASDHKASSSTSDSDGNGLDEDLGEDLGDGYDVYK